MNHILHRFYVHYSRPHTQYYYICVHLKGAWVCARVYLQVCVCM